MTTEADVQARWMERCGVAKRYREPLCEHLPGRGEIVAYCDRLKANCEEGRGLMLIGGHGTRRTMGLAYIVSEARTALPGSSVVLMTNIHKINGQLRHHPDALAALANVTLLLIDDFGGEHRPDWGFERFDALVEERYSQQRATCVGTKVAVEELENVPLLSRVMSRWGEVMTTVVLPKVDHRQTTEERREELREAGYL